MLTKLTLRNFKLFTDFHVLASFVPLTAIDDEIKRALDTIYEVAQRAQHSE